jgi:signal transduction histidine kinase
MTTLTSTGVEGASLSSPPGRRTLSASWLHRLSLEMTAARALVIAVALALVAGAGDAATGAETAFTLFYLLPVGIASWFCSRRAAYLLAVLATAWTLGVALSDPAHSAHPAVHAWNGAMDLLVYAAFVALLGRLRARLTMEERLRREALDQLRHSERLNTVGKLASGLAHELGTPLNVISGRAELIGAGQLDANAVGAYATIIAQQAERMTLIIRSLLDFSRRGGTAKAVESVRRLCDETAALLRPLAANVGVELVVTGDDGDAPINRAELQQVLSNLITNAVQAMPHGGTVTVSIGEQTVAAPGLPARLKIACTAIRVRDEGVGIPPEVLPKIFDPFFTTKDVGQGTGLGLAVSYGIVSDHDGWIRVDSRLGHGTTFAVYLPK